MNGPAKDLSLTLDSVARAVAEWAVSRHAELDPSLAARYGDDWRRSWVADTEMRIRQLAQAIAVRCPELMVDAVAWARAAHAARGLDGSDIDTNLRSLSDVIATEVPEPVREIALSYIARAVEEGPQAEPANGVPLVPDEPHGQLALRYLEAILSGRRRAAEVLVMQTAENGTSLHEIYNRVLTPAQAEVGRMWHRGEITVADEHLATMTAEMVMAMLRHRFSNATENGRCMLATSVGGDLHSIAVRMVADFFELEGWRSICLGANTPVQDITQALHDHQVDLLALSASSGLYVRAIGEVIDAIRTDPALSNVRVVVGGRPFNLAPDLWKEVDADGYAETAEGSVALGNQLVPTARSARASDDHPLT